ncbi:hypothetical protein [Paraburkholderia sp. SIMBA_054]|uniref:hypothetical protein n=1 Tax=Paraburkholderia sp. SIMBA_054 TaxID=3085795 RepID=UPI00397D592F
MLNWARNPRRGRGGWAHHIPASAFDGEPFVVAEGELRMQAAGGDRLWRFEVEHRGTGYSPRMWKLEAFVADRDTHDEVGVRVSVMRDERERTPSSTPSLIKTFIHRHTLLDAGVPVVARPLTIGDDSYVQFRNLLHSSARVLPVVAISQNIPRSGPSCYLLDPVRAATVLQGFAHVAAVPTHQSFRLTADVGRDNSVFRGAVRIYMPGFGATSNKTDHYLYLPERVSKYSGPRSFEVTLAARLRQISVESPWKGEAWPDTDVRESHNEDARARSITQLVRDRIARLFSR